MRISTYRKDLKSTIKALKTWRAFQPRWVRTCSLNLIRSIVHLSKTKQYKTSRFSLEFKQDPESHNINIQSIQNAIQPWIAKVLVAKLRLTLYDPMHCSLPGSSVHGDYPVPGSSPGGSREFEGWTALVWEKLIYWLILDWIRKK